MSKQIEVKLEFINNKGKLKKVKFYIDKQTYELLNHHTVSAHFKHQYLIDEYHAYERERNYQRKHSNIDVEMLLSQQVIEGNYNFEVSNELFDEDINQAFEKLNKRQQELLLLKYFEHLTQEEIAKKYRITKQSVSDAMQRIYATLRKNIKNKKN